jgi:large subunit ribosomal protein L10
MSKPIKSMVMNELKQRYAGVDSACVVDMTGLNVQAQEKLRKSLRGKSARVQVVKNSMARRAFDGGPLAPLGKSLEGPCVLITSSQSLIEIAKSLIDAAREYKQLKLKKAIIEGDPNLLSIEELSRMRGRLELLGEVAMLIASPGRAIAGCLRGPQSKIAGCLKAMADKGEGAAG